LLFNFRSQNELLDVVVGCITEEKREISISDIISNQLNALFSKIFKEKFSFEVFFYRQQVNKELRRYICTTLRDIGEVEVMVKNYQTEKINIIPLLIKNSGQKGVKNSRDKKFTRR